jgi:hypothetical protein
LDDSVRNSQCKQSKKYFHAIWLFFMQNYRNAKRFMQI